MRHNRGVITVWTFLIVLVLDSLPVARSAFAVKPGPDQTSLDVRQPGAQPQWASSRTIHSLHIVHFRWQSTAVGTAYGVWQIFDYKPQPMDPNEIPFDQAKTAPIMPEQLQQFQIDFAQLQQQYPNMIPANAPASGKDYYLRIVPYSVGETPAGLSSDTVKITYVKSPPPPPEPPSFNYVAEFWKGGHFVDIGYSTNKPVVPVITISTSKPVKNAQGNPVFDKHAKIVSTSFAFLGGYDKEGEVRLSGLMPKTHFHYIIMAKDEKGGVAYKTGQFTTATRFITVTFEKIFMIDDSDGFPSGAGDMNFAFFVKNVNVLGINKTVPPREQMDFPTGETRVFNIFTTIDDPPNLVTARVNGHDTDDCGNILFHPLCDCDRSLLIILPHMVNGRCKDGSGESAAAITTLHIPDVTDRSQFGIEFAQKSFTMAGDNHHLKFKVFGNFTVRYH